MIKGKTIRSAILVIMVHLTFLAIMASCTKQPTGKKTWEQAHAEAFQIIATRDEWPSSPEAVVKAFWKARRAKNYPEMEIFWPGSGSWNWPEICKGDSSAKLVFGKAAKNNSEVPYASEEYFNKNGSYNLNMKMSSLQTEKGHRHYIVSGN